ncbi:unnamed protein product [Orchesella dallaii]|uniref:Uncharacterized protein n=1 Tax=Orchesella dallaii TaxID=48710 RepID=A0ABP1S9F5_9HEXA
MELTSRPLIAQVAVADASTSSRSMPVVKANSAKGRIHRPWREKRTLKGKKAQNINPAKSLGKQKRFSTRKPAGAVALAPTNRVAADCDDPNDITFAPPTGLIDSHPDQRNDHPIVNPELYVLLWFMSVQIIYHKFKRGKESLVHDGTTSS